MYHVFVAGGRDSYRGVFPRMRLGFTLIKTRRGWGVELGERGVICADLGVWGCARDPVGESGGGGWRMGADSTVSGLCPPISGI